MWGGGSRCQPRAKRGFVIIFPLIKQAAALLPLSEKAADYTAGCSSPSGTYSFSLGKQAALRRRRRRKPARHVLCTAGIA